MSLTLKVGEYSISDHPPIPNTEQKNLLWIEKDGEGMSIDLDAFWRENSILKLLKGKIREMEKYIKKIEKRGKV